MSDQIKDKFINALNEIEQNENYDSMNELFADSSEIGNVAMTESFHGQDGAREFWKSYRESFKEVSSTFQNEIVSDSRVALEWTTEFNRNDGNRNSYRGVSIIETDGGKITRFFAYFDPQSLGEKLTENAQQSKEA